MVFTGIWFGVFGVVLRLPSEKYKIVSWMKKEVENLIDLLVSFSFVFVIDIIVYSLRFNIHGKLKKKVLINLRAAFVCASVPN